MTSSAVFHETLVFQRIFTASPKRIFQAWADPEARARWGAPSPTAEIEFVRFDFRPGGEAVSNCGAKGDLRYRVEVRHLDIDHGRRIIYSERVSEGDRMMGCSLITVDLIEDGSGTRLIVTDQAASVGGRDYIQGSALGLNAALDNLGREVEAQSAVR